MVLGRALADLVDQHDHRPAEVRLGYRPGQVWEGRVEYIYPSLDPKTRTLRVRLRFDNPGELLKPNMYAEVTIFGKLRPRALTVAREAVIRGPDRDRVVVALGDGLRAQAQHLLHQRCECHT